MEDDITALWLSVSDLVLEICEIRDRYLNLVAEEGRFMQLQDIVSNLQTLENTLFEYRELKNPLFSKKPDRLMSMAAKSAIECAKTALEIAKDDLSLKTIAPDGSATLDQNIIVLQLQLKSNRLSDQTRDKVEKALGLARSVKRQQFLNSINRDFAQSTPASSRGSVE